MKKSIEHRVRKKINNVDWTWTLTCGMDLGFKKVLVDRRIGADWPKRICRFHSSHCCVISESVF